MNGDEKGGGTFISMEGITILKLRKENIALRAERDAALEERDALKKTLEMAEILIKRYEAGGGPLK